VSGSTTSLSTATSTGVRSPVVGRSIADVPAFRWRTVASGALSDEMFWKRDARRARFRRRQVPSPVARNNPTNRPRVRAGVNAPRFCFAPHEPRWCQRAGTIETKAQNCSYRPFVSKH
jgi:hypothetical protein